MPLSVGQDDPPTYADLVGLKEQREVEKQMETDNGQPIRPPQANIELANYPLSYGS